MRPQAASAVNDWNVVVTAYPQGRRPALRALRRFGRASGSGHYNVLLATVDDPVALLDTLEGEAQTHAVLVDSISKVAPALACFDYAGDEEFERQSVAAALPWLPRLADKSFHVRVHPRGARLTAKGHEMEARLGAALLAAVAKSGASASIDFDDPDFVLTIDAVQGRAGVGLWTRQEMRRHRFLRPD